MTSYILRLMFHVWVASGSLDAALVVASQCDTPTSWAEQDTEDSGYWFAVCGTADGKVCGEDVSWTSKECEPKEEP